MELTPGQTVLFMGDSITHAHRRADEVHDCYQLGCGYANSVAGELAGDHPGGGWRFVNRGRCGDTVGDLCDRWASDCLGEAPAAISILVGINDAIATAGRPDRFRTRYAQLLDTTRRRLPAARLMLLEPFGVAVPPHPTVEVVSRGQLDRLADLQPVVRELATATGATFVPLRHLFTEAASAVDGIHPSAAGHWRIGRAWVAAARGAGWFPPGAP